MSKEIVYLTVPAAMTEFAESRGARFSMERGWYVIGRVPPELDEFLIREPREAKQAIIRCPECGGQMAVRHSRKGGDSFWGCLSYPNCMGTLPYDEGVTGQGNISTILDSFQKTKKHTSYRKPAKQPLTERNQLVEELASLALGVFKTPAGVERWFSSPLVILCGKRPVDVLHDREAVEKIRAFLREI